MISSPDGSNKRMLQMVLYCGPSQEKNTLCPIQQHVHAAQLSVHWLKEAVLKVLKVQYTFREKIN